MSFQPSFLVPGIYLCGRRNNWRGGSSSASYPNRSLWVFSPFFAFMIFVHFGLFLNSDFWWLMGERFKRTFFNISQTLWGWLLQAALLSNHHLTRAHSPARDLADQKWIVLAGHPIFDSRRQIPAWPWLWGALPWWRYPLGHRSEWHISTVCVPGLIGGCGRLQVSRERVGERGR